MTELKRLCRELTAAVDRYERTPTFARFAAIDAAIRTAYRRWFGADTDASVVDAIVDAVREVVAPECKTYSPVVVHESPDIAGLRAAAKVLANIADKYDDNGLDDEARKTWGLNDEHHNNTPPDKIELYTGRGGGTLLTLGDCMRARDALKPVGRLYTQPAGPMPVAVAQEQAAPTPRGTDGAAADGKPLDVAAKPKVLRRWNCVGGAWLTSSYYTWDGKMLRVHRNNGSSAASEFEDVDTLLDAESANLIEVSPDGSPLPDSSNVPTEPDPFEQL